jgi:hypothetical protein
LAFAGDFTPVLAKHSKSFSLVDCISVGVDRMQRNFEPMHSHDFNFLLINIPKGIQHIRVEGSVEQGPTVIAAFGVIGKGSLEATVVNLKEEGE